MITTTLNRIRAHRPCGMYPRENPLTGFCKLRAGLGPNYGDDTPIPFAEIVRINGLDDALWCCRAEPHHSKEWRVFAVWCARQVQHLMKDKRSIDALDVAEKFANGEASQAELTAAAAAAGAAARTQAGAVAQAAAQAAEAIQQGDAEGAKGAIQAMVQEVKQKMKHIQ